MLTAALRARGEVELIEARQRFRMRPGGAGRRRNPLRSAANLLLDAAWLHVGLPRAARAAAADVLHHPLPADSRGAPCPQVVTVQDVAFELRPDDFDPVWRRLASRRHRRAVRRAGAVVCISEATARDAAGLLGAPRDRIVVAPLGPGQQLPPVPRVATPGHFLYVGDAEPRKGVGRLIAGYGEYRAGRTRAGTPSRAHPSGRTHPGAPIRAQAGRQAGRQAGGDPLDLVLAGASAGEAAAAAPGVRGEASPAPERLAELYASAAALVHPSAHEGFGLTLLEAMTLGTPVVAVRNPAVEEVCGEAALLIERAELPAVLDRLQEDIELRDRLSEAGRARAARFSWDEAARRHEAAYTLAAGP